MKINEEKTHKKVTVKMALIFFKCLYRVQDLSQLLHFGCTSATPVSVSAVCLTVKLADKKYLSSQCGRLAKAIPAGDAEGGGGGGDVRFGCTLSGLRLEATAELR